MSQRKKLANGGISGETISQLPCMNDVGGCCLSHPLFLLALLFRRTVFPKNRRTLVESVRSRQGRKAHLRHHDAVKISVSMVWNF
jgi:hypothetical protein